MKKKKCEHKFKLFPIKYYTTEGDCPNAVQAVCEKCLKSYITKPADYIT